MESATNRKGGGGGGRSAQRFSWPDLIHAIARRRASRSSWHLLFSNQPGDQPFAWQPVSEVPKYSIWPLLVTLKATIIAVPIAIPLAVGAVLYKLRDGA